MSLRTEKGQPPKKRDCPFGQCRLEFFYSVGLLAARPMRPGKANT
jgi:hypothetical protein